MNFDGLFTSVDFDDGEIVFCEYIGDFTYWYKNVTICYWDDVFDSVPLWF